MALCPECGYFTKINKGKTFVNCKRCNFSKILQPNYPIEGQINKQGISPPAEAEFPDLGKPVQNEDIN